MRLADRRHRLVLSAPVLCEWLRGPRTAAELAAQKELLPTEAVVSFGPRDADLAADLYRRVKRPRGREIDLTVAACAIAHEAALWTLNTPDFRDIPGLRLVEAE